MKRYFILSNLLLLTMLSYFTVKGLYQIAAEQLSAEPLSTSGVTRAASPENETRHPVTHYSAITDRNLFNTKTQADQKPASAAPAEPPKQTELKLKLWGTVSGGEAIKPYAVIEDQKTKEQNLYKEGDTVQTALVKQILREKIILNVNGKDEILQMESDEKALASAKDAANPSPEAPPSVAQSPPTSSAESGNVTLQRAQIEDAVNNVNNLMKQARIRPHFENGKPDGLALTNIQPDSIFTKLGLISGDILTGVDGKEIKSVDDALKFYQNLKSSSNVSIQIKRRGESKTIDYRVE